MTEHQSDARIVALGELDDSAALRDRARDIRDRSIAEMPQLIDALVARLQARGVHVHRAATAAEAADIVAAIVARHGGPVVKGKSMVSEEIGLNERLEAEGHEVYETDLGEFIVQTAGQQPEHLLAPAIHWDREAVRDLFQPLADHDLSDDPDELMAFARAHLRSKFEHARVGITGVNFGVAETGTLAIVSNEGNGRMTAAFPPVHIALMGIERVVADLADLGVLLPLLVRSATGQRFSSYVSLISGPRLPGEEDGPEEMHLVLLDNGRSQLRDTQYAAVLRCIRCGACQSICPVFRQVGGSAYGWVYGGPIGAVLTPLLRGEPSRLRPEPCLVAVCCLRRCVPGADPAARPAARPAPRPCRRHCRHARAGRLPRVERALEPAVGLPRHHAPGTARRRAFRGRPGGSRAPGTCGGGRDRPLPRAARGGRRKVLARA